MVSLHESNSAMAAPVQGVKIIGVSVSVPYSRCPYIFFIQIPRLSET